MSKPIRVLIVDDSATMRGLIAAVLSTDPRIEVCGQAEDPIQARQLIKSLDPDVVTLDVEMPNMNGIEFLRKIMALRPTPVIMVSTLTQKGTEITMEALEIGAVDCVGKPVSGVNAAGDFAKLAAKIHIAAQARVRGNSGPVAKALGLKEPWSGQLIAIGSSTGGVEALGQVIPALPANCPPVVITQHMPAAFTASLASRLNRVSAAEVREARSGDRLEPGKIFIAPGGPQHLRVVKNGENLHCELVEEGLVNGHCPSVDVLFKSVAKAVGPAAVGVILTGMGRDGAEGLLDIKKCGGHTLGQNEQTCVVYGMPRVAWELGAVEHQYPIERMAAGIIGACEAELGTTKNASRSSN